MNKEVYEKAELDIIRFESQDVITTSGWLDDNEYQTPKVGI